MSGNQSSCNDSVRRLNTYCLIALIVREQIQVIFKDMHGLADHPIYQQKIHVQTPSSSGSPIPLVQALAPTHVSTRSRAAFLDPHSTIPTPHRSPCDTSRFISLAPTQPSQRCHSAVSQIHSSARLSFPLFPLSYTLQKIK